MIFRDITDIIDALNVADISRQLQSDLVNACKPCRVFTPCRGNETAIDRSFFTGAPEVPLNFEWPWSIENPNPAAAGDVSDIPGAPLWLLAQIKVSKQDKMFPAIQFDGRLTFWSAAERQWDMFSDELHSDWMVLYIPEDTPITVAAIPVIDDKLLSRFSEGFPDLEWVKNPIFSKIEFTSKDLVSFPDGVLQNLGLKDDQYIKVKGELRKKVCVSNYEHFHMLGGHPETIKSDPDLILRRALDLLSQNGKFSDRKLQLMAHFDTIEETGMIFPFNGRVHFIFDAGIGGGDSGAVKILSALIFESR